MGHIGIYSNYKRIIVGIFTYGYTCLYIYIYTYLQKASNYDRKLYLVPSCISHAPLGREKNLLPTKTLNPKP